MANRKLNNWIWLAVVIFLLLCFIRAAIAYFEERDYKISYEKSVIELKESADSLENLNKAIYSRVFELERQRDSLDIVIEKKLSIIEDMEEKFNEKTDSIYNMPLDSAISYFSREVSSEMDKRK